MLDNFYHKSRNSIEAGKKEAPFGFVIPAGQADPTRVAFVVKILRMQGIEIGKTSAELKLSEGTFPAGSLVIKRDQPYGRLAKILLEKQTYPDNNLRTYDDAAWTMGLMTHTKIVESADRSILDAGVQPLTSYTPEAHVPSDSRAGWYAVADHGSADMITLRYQLKNVPVRIAEESFKSGDQSIPAGSFIVPGQIVR